VAVHTEYGPIPASGLAERAFRGVVAILVVLAFTTVGVIGGYEYGRRSRPSSSDIATQRDTAVQAAVSRAVASRAKADHVKRLRVERRYAAWVAQRWQVRLENAVNQAHIQDGQAAALAFKRGRAAAAKAPKPK
jgi:hypothetical protein